MSIFGVSVILIGGIVNMLLILFQVLGGLKVIKVPFKVHKWAGITLLITAAAHATLAILASN
jgi:hypothetical protein